MGKDFTNDDDVILTSSSFLTSFSLVNVLAFLKSHVCFVFLESSPKCEKMARFLRSPRVTIPFVTDVSVDVQVNVQVNVQEICEKSTCPVI